MAYRSAASSIISTRVRSPRRCGSERSFSNTNYGNDRMTKQRFGKQSAMGGVIAVALLMPAASATKVGRLMRAGDVLSGELNALRVRGGTKGKRIATYQLTSEPHRLPPP